MAITTLSDLQTYINTIYERAIFVARERNLMAGLVRNFRARGWMDRKLLQWSQVTAETVADGQDYSNPQTFSKSLLATLSPQEAIAQVTLTDQAIETDPDDARNSAARELGNAIAEKVDTDLVDCFASFSTDKGPGAGNSATLATAAAAIAKLRDEKTPAPIYVVMHPYHWHDIWVELGQPAANYSFLGDLANQAMRDYFVAGPLIGATWFVSANISEDANDDAVSGIFNPQAIGLDVRRPPRLEPERDASLRAWELNMTMGYACGVIRDEWGVKYTADATEP